MKRMFFTGAAIILSLFAIGQQKNLDYFIQQGLDNSPLLKDYQNQVQINRVDSQRIRATYKPQVTGTSNNAYAPVIKGYGYDGAITNGGQLSALVGVNQVLVSKKYLYAQFETLSLQNQGIENTAKLSEQDLTRTIVAQYVTTFGDMQQLQFAREVNALLKKEENLLKSLTQTNVYRQTDYLTFLVTRQQQELSVKQLSIQLQNDYATLNYMAGIIDTAEAILAEPAITLHQLPEISQSVFFRKFTLDSLQLGNNRSLVDFNYKPKVNLYADAGYSSTLVYQAYKNFGTSFGVNVTIPIFDGRQKKLQYSKIAIAERTRIGYKDFYTSQYSQQVAQLSQQLKATGELIDEINHQIKYAEGLINVNIKLLETGDAKIADLVIAVNNYMMAKNLLTQNNTSRLQIINQINYWNR
ncbi:MAG: TolC family protein [Chitinophagaceae bacterium]